MVAAEDSREIEERIDATEGHSCITMAVEYQRGLFSPTEINQIQRQREVAQQAQSLETMLRTVVYTAIAKACLYAWSVVVSLASLTLFIIGFYFMIQKELTIMAPPWAYYLTVFISPGITMTSLLCICGLNRHRQCVIDGKRNDYLYLFTGIGGALALFMVIGGVLAVQYHLWSSRASRSELKLKDVSSFEMDVVKNLVDFTRNQASAWTNLQDEYICCGYYNVEKVAANSSLTEPESELLESLLVLDSAHGSFCSTKERDCSFWNGNVCPHFGYAWCRRALLDEITQGYKVVAACAWVVALSQIIAIALTIYVVKHDIPPANNRSYEQPLADICLAPVRSPRQQQDTLLENTLSDIRHILKATTEMVGLSSNHTRRRSTFSSQLAQNKGRVNYKKNRDLPLETFRGLSVQETSIPLPSFLGKDVAESCRTVSTLTSYLKRELEAVKPIAWGYNNTDGALGLYKTVTTSPAISIPLFKRQILRSISAGERLSLFLIEDGNVFQSGRLFPSQDGHIMWKPSKVPLMNEPPVRIVSIEAGHFAAFTVDENGHVYSWGVDYFGQLGHCNDLEEEEAAEEVDELEAEDVKGDSLDSSLYESKECPVEKIDDENQEEIPAPQLRTDKLPQRIESLCDIKVINVFAGNHFAIAVSSTGFLYSWGRGIEGQLGHGEFASSSTPTAITALFDYVPLHISAGDYHVVAIFRKRHADFIDGPNSVFTWGESSHGRLGLGETSPQSLPQEALFFQGLQPTKVAAGSDHTLVLCTAGAESYVYAFGGNEEGQLGIASTDSIVYMPHLIHELSAVHVASIGAGSRYSCALSADGQVYVWGDGMYSKAGSDTIEANYVPRTLDSWTKHNITQLSIGKHHALGLFRAGANMDRWRDVSMGAVTPYLDMSDQVHTVCFCEAVNSASKEMYQIYVKCDTCEMEPICRLCQRRCHANHVLRPSEVNGFELNCACGTSTKSNFNYQVGNGLKEARTKFNKGCFYRRRFQASIVEEEKED